MPRPWRVKALRIDGQVVPNWVAAAFTLPSCSASAWPARLRPGRSGTGWATSPPAAGHAEAQLVTVGQNLATLARPAES
jgi:hypothetical protein